MDDDRIKRAARAVRSLRAANQAGSGRASGGLGPDAVDRLAELDTCTMAYRTWSPALVPGLLQTPGYTAGAIKAHTPGIEVRDLGRLVERRRRRRDAFFERHEMTGALASSSLNAWFLIGETAIRRPLMNAHSHADQLQQLLNIINEPQGITIQVMPDDTPVPVVAEPFSLFYLDPAPVVAHLETVIGGWYSVVPDDTDRLKRAYSDMVGRAMSTRETREYIEEELHLCLAATAEPTSSSPATPIPRTASTSPDLPSGA